MSEDKPDQDVSEMPEEKQEAETPADTTGTETSEESVPTGGAADEGAEAWAVPAQDAPSEVDPPPEPQLNLTIPVALIAAQLLIALFFSNISTTPFQTYMGIGVAPALGALGLLAWWLLSREVPIRERLIGVALAAAGLAVPAFLQRPIWMDGAFLLVYVLPTLTTALVITLMATRGMRWAVRRKALAGALLLCAAGFCLVKVAGVDGTMTPLLAWRWQSPPTVASTAENSVAALPEALVPEDWPGFRGQRRDGRNMVSIFGTDWSENPPTELWRRPVGRGWSSFAVIGNYCFTQEQRGENEAVVCYETDSGNEVWVNTVPAHFTDVMGDGPRATPEYHKGKLYTQGATGILQCIDAATGTTVWQRNIKDDAGMAEIPQWGFSSSPLAIGELVIAYSGAGDGKSVIAYQQADGGIAWTGGQGENGYSSPHFGEVAATPQVLMSSNYGIEAFDPASGAVLWEQEWNLKGNPRVAQPFVLDLFNLYAGTGQGKGVRLIKVTKEGDALTPEAIYTSEGFHPYFNDFAYHDGYLYGFDGTRFTCMETTDGTVRFQGERWGGQLLVLNEMDMLVVLTEAGEVILVAAFPTAPIVRGRFQALDSKTWNHPVVAHGKLFVRNDREAVCYALPPAAVDDAQTDGGE